MGSKQMERKYHSSKTSYCHLYFFSKTNQIPNLNYTTKESCLLPPKHIDMTVTKLLTVHPKKKNLVTNDTFNLWLVFNFISTVFIFYFYFFSFQSFKLHLSPIYSFHLYIYIYIYLYMIPLNPMYGIIRYEWGCVTEDDREWKAV